jgi:hypothetical protein
MPVAIDDPEKWLEPDSTARFDEIKPLGAEEFVGRPVTAIKDIAANEPSRAREFLAI